MKKPYRDWLPTKVGGYFILDMMQWLKIMQTKSRLQISDTGFYMRLKFELWSFTFTSYLCNKINDLIEIEVWRNEVDNNSVTRHDANFESPFLSIVIHHSLKKNLGPSKKKNSCWPETDHPIGRRRHIGPFLLAMFRRWRFNHFPHNLNICIFSTWLHVFIKTNKSISVSCM